MDYLDKINYIKKIKGTTLDLNHIGLKEVPLEIKDITSLINLSLNGNRIKEIPSWLSNLPNLSTIELKNNQIEMLPSTLGNNGKLTKIDVSNNKIKQLPKSLKHSKRLITINVANNNIKDFPRWIFEFSNIDRFVNSTYDSSGVLMFGNNPIETPPIEILNQERSAIINYFDEIKEKSQYLYEAKFIIVGEPGAGKTTLARKIINLNSPMPKQDETTHGIEILKYKFKVKDNQDFRMSIWDFGGQEIYKSTHQFFLTKSSLYILLSDNRAENTDFNYWLQTIEILTNNSPLIIVQNEKQNRHREINEQAMRGRFSNLLKAINVNLLTNKNLSELIREIEHQIQLLPHIGKHLPKSWIDIREDLEQLALQKDYIAINEYYKVCRSNGIDEIERCNFLSNYLHDLGVFLHFQDNPILKNILILKSSWVTDAVYRVLDNSTVISNKGMFNKSDLGIIWFEEKYKNKLDDLLEIMIKFELCYRIANSQNFIAPQLLAINQPLYTWENKSNLVVRYVFDFMPKGIMTRLIVKLHHLIESERYVWKEGVVLYRDNTKAEIIEIYGKYEIKIRIQGLNKTELLAIITDSLDEILKQFERLKYEQLIPCNCKVCKLDENNVNYYKFSNLKKRKTNGRRYIECDTSFEKVDILSLIGDLPSEYISKEHLLNLIGESNFDAIFDYLLYYLTSDSEYNSVILIKGRYNSLNMELRNGTIDYSKRDLELNQIRKSLLDLVIKIENSPFS